LDLTDNAIDILKARYLQDNDETPKDMFMRIAKHVGGWDGRTGEYFDLMSGLYFLPNSPTLRHAGVTKGCLSACFCLPIEDSRESIFDTLAKAVNVQSAGGGTGYNFSKLRPRGSIVGKYGATSSGPVSFMEIFDLAIGRIIRQGGVRDGAQMGILNADHKDIMEFIKSKHEEGRLTNFNISVGIPDGFMDSLESSADNRKIWEAIINGAWKNGEPGVIFLDTVNKTNPLGQVEYIWATNPCAENPLPAYGSCNLGSINLTKVVVNDDIDWELLSSIVRLSVRFLDDVIDVNNYPLPEIEEYAKGARRIGLGVMGFADMLLLLKIAYSSKEALQLATRLSKFIYDTANNESHSLGQERGVPPLVEKCGMNRRNGALLSIAPTGTLSQLANCSSGIEPNFSWRYEKRCIGKTITVINPIYKKLIDENVPSYFETTMNISAIQHVEMLAAWQKHVDTGVSKTINAPNHATKDDVDSAFKLAYKLGCKAVSFYRDGSRVIQALTKKRSRGSWVTGGTRKVKTGYGNVYITMNWLEGNDLIEVFTHIGKSSSEVNCMTEAIGRLISLARKHEVPVEDIVKQLKDIGGDKPITAKGGTIKSIPDAIARAIEEKFCKGKNVDPNNVSFTNNCPVCGKELLFSEGCMKCMSCGFDRCG